MKNKQILFTDIHKAELVDTEICESLAKNDVLCQMEYTVVSGGTERVCIMGLPNTPQKYPLRLGYCGVGRVIGVGDEVCDLKCGDRVLVYHGNHGKYNIRGREEITKVECDKIPSLYASMVIIAAMGLGGVRKLELELGECAMVMGLGLLGMFSIQFARLSGANPLIAVDPNEKRRALALKLGADYALDPMEEGFAEKVKAITKGRGVRGTVEVTGSSVAMKQALLCSSYMGRISLLGCTRVSDCQIDYYSQVHRPGVKLIGAHNTVRPKLESFPHHWTHQDDCKAILDMIETGRLQMEPMVARVVSPTEAPEIFNQLCDDPDFPMATIFDWRNI